MHANYVVKVLTLHLFIVLLYVTITSYEFVADKFPNPIGIGLKQWLYVTLHLLATITITAIIWRRSANKRTGRNKFMLNIGAIILWIGILLIFSNALSRWLWSLR
jgi:hypothetical protein